MNTPPAQFIADFHHLRERIHWALLAVANGSAIAGAQAVLDEWADFYRRWSGNLTEAALRDDLERVQQQFIPALAGEIERHWLSQLSDAVTARRKWGTAEQLLKMDVTLHGIIQKAPEPMRGSLLDLYREHMHQEYDAAASYREAEQHAAAAETAFRKSLATLTALWPDRADPALHNRLENLDLPGADTWLAELGEKEAALPPPPAAAPED